MYVCVLSPLICVSCMSRVQAFNVIATPIRQAKTAAYHIKNRVLDINHVDVSPVTVVVVVVVDWVSKTKALGIFGVCCHRRDIFLLPNKVSKH